MPLPAGARPLSVVTGRGLSVVLAGLDGRQRAYAGQRNLARARPGPRRRGGARRRPAAAAVMVETALTDPGRAGRRRPTASGRRPDRESAHQLRPGRPGQPELRDFAVRRYDSAGQRGRACSQFLPAGTRVAADTAVGLVVWQPVNGSSTPAWRWSRCRPRPC